MPLKREKSQKTSGPPSSTTKSKTEGKRGILTKMFARRPSFLKIKTATKEESTTAKQPKAKLTPVRCCRTGPGEVSFENSAIVVLPDKKNATAKPYRYHPYAATTTGRTQTRVVPETPTATEEENETTDNIDDIEDFVNFIKHADAAQYCAEQRNKQHSSPASSSSSCELCHLEKLVHKNITTHRTNDSQQELIRTNETQQQIDENLPPPTSSNSCSSCRCTTTDDNTQPSRANITDSIEYMRDVYRNRNGGTLPTWCHDVTIHHQSNTAVEPSDASSYTCTATAMSSMSTPMSSLNSQCPNCAAMALELVDRAHVLLQAAQLAKCPMHCSTETALAESIDDDTSGVSAIALSPYSTNRTSYVTMEDVDQQTTDETTRTSTISSSYTSTDDESYSEWAEDDRRTNIEPNDQQQMSPKATAEQPPQPPPRKIHPTNEIVSKNSCGYVAKLVERFENFNKH